MDAVDNMVVIVIMVTIDIMVVAMIIILVMVAMVGYQVPVAPWLAVAVNMYTNNLENALNCENFSLKSIVAGDETHTTHRALLV